jgi:tetratricopeptide (TPR) repeat protein
MAFDYTEEGSFFALSKLRKLHPYFNMAIIYLSQFSESITPPQGEGVLEISTPVIYPQIAFLDDPYPIIQCQKRIFSGQTKIQISYGIFTILGMMGEFEKAIDRIVRDRTKQASLSLESIWDSDISGIVQCIKDVLKYLESSYNAYPEEVPEIPPLSLSTDLLDEALQFIVGHELAHYLDPYYNYDYRNNQQLEVLDNSFELLKGLKSTPYKKYVNQYMRYLDKFDNTEDHYLQTWSEEVLADFEGYHFLCTGVPVGYLGMRKILAMSLSFIAMRIVEYFESTLDPEVSGEFFVPIRWRASFLQYTLYKKYGAKYKYFSEFITNEWGTYQLADTLFERALIEIESEKEDGKVVATKDTTVIVAEKIALCKELISKMQEVSLLEANKVFKDIRRVYNENYWVPGFKATFETKELAEVLYHLGYISYSIKQYEEAYTWFYRSSNFYEQSEDLPGLPEAKCYEQLGNLCYDMEDYEEAIAWYNEALFIRHKVIRLPYRDNVTLYLHVARNSIKTGDRITAKSYLKGILDYAEDKEIIIEAMRYLDIISD